MILIHGELIDFFVYQLTQHQVNHCEFLYDFLQEHIAEEDAFDDAMDTIFALIGFTRGEYLSQRGPRFVDSASYPKVRD